MSVRWIGWVWEHSPYDRTQLLIHMAFADYANDDGECYPKQITIAKKSRCSRRYVRETVADMEDRGLLISARRAGTSNLYTLLQPVPDGGVGTPAATGVGTPDVPNLGTTDATNRKGTINITVSPSDSDKSSQTIDEHEPEELTYGENVDDEWAAESAKKKRPKWQTPTASMMKYMSPFGRKWFKTREERTKCKQLLSLLTADRITTEWVENVLSWATKPNPNRDFGTLWSFDGFLNKAINVEHYRDWQIRFDNAKRDGEDATFDPTDLGQLRDRYEED